VSILLSSVWISGAYRAIHYGPDEDGVNGIYLVCCVDLHTSSAFRYYTKSWLGYNLQHNLDTKLK